jgi:DNA-binding NarL/FixJ family response regulator
MCQKYFMTSHTRVRVPSVLVVDDSPPLRTLIRRVLELEGMVVTTASSRAEGIAQTGTFAVGVFDLDLGDGNGVEVATHLLATGQVAACVFFSGGAPRSVMEGARALGVLFSKGDGLGALVEHVRHLVSGDAGQRRRA